MTGMNIDISWGGVVFLAVLLAASFGLLYVYERSMLLKSLRALVRMVGSLLILGACVWGLYKLNIWWVNVLWAVVLLSVVSLLAVQKARVGGRLHLPMLLSVLVSSAVVGFTLMRCFSGHVPASVFFPVVAALSGHLFLSSSATLQTYVSSLIHTEEHYQYLIANGASHIEAIMPSVRRALRASVLPALRQWTSPIVFCPPLLLCGLLLGGVQPVTATVATLLFLSGMFVSGLLSAVLLLIFSDRYLFDRQGRLIR